jgi:hypothetical protein
MSPRPHRPTKNTPATATPENRSIEPNPDASSDEDADDEGEDAGDEGEDAGDEGEDAGDEGEDAGDEGEDAGDEGEDVAGVGVLRSAAVCSAAGAGARLRRALIR